MVLLLNGAKNQHPSRITLQLYVSERKAHPGTKCDIVHQEILHHHAVWISVIQLNKRWVKCDSLSETEMEITVSPAVWTHQSKSLGRREAGRMFRRLWRERLLLYWPAAWRSKHSSSLWLYEEQSGLTKASVDNTQKCSHLLKAVLHCTHIVPL